MNTPLTPSKRGIKKIQMSYKLLIFLLQVNIEEKIKNAPDKGYEIGVVIGTYLPFVFFIGLAYLTYYLAKKRKK